MNAFNDFKVTRSKRKSLAIFVTKEGKIEVKAPHYIPNFLIKSFVNSKSDWIEERLTYVLKNKRKERVFSEGEKFMYLGENYLLELGNYTQITLNDKRLLFPIAMRTQGKFFLEKWYLKEAKKVIKTQLDFYSKKIDLPYKSVAFSDTSSKWGSCTHDNRLQFNWRLIMAPMIVIRYVIIHELVHTIHKNHSSSFWRKVSEQNPSYKQQIKWLKTHGEMLHF